MYVSQEGRLLQSREKHSQDIYKALYEGWKTDVQNINHHLVWTGAIPEIEMDEAEDLAIFTFHTKQESFELEMGYDIGEWLATVFPTFYYQNDQLTTLKTIALHFEEEFDADFNMILESDIWETLREKGLLLVRF